MKDALCLIACMVALLPCLLILNESESFLPNLAGFIYAVILFLASRTKVAKNVFKHAYKANYKFECWLFNKEKENGNKKM